MLCNGKFTHVRRRRQADCYQYNGINPVAQNKYIIKRLLLHAFTRRPSVVDNAKIHIFASCSPCSNSSRDRAVFLSKVIKIFLNVKA